MATPAERTACLWPGHEDGGVLVIDAAVVVGDR